MFRQLMTRRTAALAFTPRVERTAVSFSTSRAVLRPRSTASDRAQLLAEEKELEEFLKFLRKAQANAKEFRTFLLLGIGCTAIFSMIVLGQIGTSWYIHHTEKVYVLPPVVGSEVRGVSKHPSEVGSSA